MIEHALDDNNDIILKNGSFITVKDGSQVVQHIRTRLLFYLGEWFMDKRAGTPWFQQVFIKPVNLTIIENVIKSRITDTPELKMITEFSMSLTDPNSRKLEITFSAETESGVINKEEIFING